MTARRALAFRRSYTRRFRRTRPPLQGRPAAHARFKLLNHGTQRVLWSGSAYCLARSSCGVASCGRRISSTSSPFLHRSCLITSFEPQRRQDLCHRCSRPSGRCEQGRSRRSPPRQRLALVRFAVRPRRTRRCGSRSRRAHYGMIVFASRRPNQRPGRLKPEVLPAVERGKLRYCLLDEHAARP